MARRFSLAPGVPYYVPFGSVEAITPTTINDEVVADLIAKFPKLAGRVFIDSEADGQRQEVKPPEAPEGLGDKPLERTSKADLHKTYFQLTGKAADQKLNHPELVALVAKEIEAAKLLG